MDDINGNTFEYYVPTEEKLDQIFGQYCYQIQTFKNSLNKSQKILCDKWVKKLGESPSSSIKLERNCLALLLMEQVVKEKQLSEPFLNYKQVKSVPLREIFLEYFKQTCTPKPNEGKSNLSSQTATNPNTLPSTTCQIKQNSETCNTKKCQHSCRKNWNNTSQEALQKLIEEQLFENIKISEQCESLNSDLVAEEEKNIQLKQQMNEFHQAKVSFQKNFNTSVNDIILSPLTTYCLNNEPPAKTNKGKKQASSNENEDQELYDLYKKWNDHFKKSKKPNADKPSSKIEVKDALPLKVFEAIFENLFKGNEQFHEDLKACDQELNVIINYYFQHIYGKRLHNYHNKAQKKLQKAKGNFENKFNERLSFTLWCYKLQMKLVRLKCFSEMREMFMQTQLIDFTSMAEMVRAIEERCDSVFQEIL